MAVALKEMVGADSDLFTTSRERINGAISRLVRAAVDSGQVRRDANPDDLLRAMSGFCLVSDQPGWQDQALRLVSLLLDGLRYGT